MVYEEDNKWKEYEKKKDYINAVKALCDEIATNLIRVHNVYSDKKYDSYEDKFLVYGYINYGKKANGERAINNEKFFEVVFYIGMCHLSVMSVENGKEEDDKKYFKLLLDELLKKKKIIIKEMKTVEASE